MKKEEFRALLKEHGQLTIGINPFDMGEISAMYALNDAGEVYEVFEIDQSGEYLCHIDDDTALQQLYDEVLCNVVSHSHENHFERCVDYIKRNLEHWEIEQGWDYIGKRMGLPNELEGRIYDLIDEFTEDNDLTDDWWDNYDVEDFFMEIDND
jgi:hypothetical protein